MYICLYSLMFSIGNGKLLSSFIFALSPSKRYHSPLVSCSKLLAECLTCSQPSKSLQSQLSSDIRSRLRYSTQSNLTEKMVPVDTGGRLTRLRSLMENEGLTAYLVPSEDSHASEYIAATDKRREWITGFDGSAGTALILRSEALLFTDGRYHQQAAKQLSNEWTLQKYGLPDVKNWQEFLATLPHASKIGVDPMLLSVADYNSIHPTLSQDSALVPVARNLIDAIWDHKPPNPKNKITLHEVKYAGQTALEKIKMVQTKCKQQNTWGTVLGMLDEIAWLLNMRGSDIAFNPVFLSYCAVPVEGKPTLFVDIEKLDTETYEYVNEIGVLVEPYDEVILYLRKVGDSLGDSTVLLPSKTNLAIASSIGLSKLTVARGPVTDLKAIKNETEIEGFRQCHLRDGVALVQYFAWLEQELNDGHTPSESEAAAELEKLRKNLPLFRGLSFTTISSFGANASIIHYSPDPINSATINKNGVYLCDSGAQFSDGTTDTTRTLHFGEPTEEEKRAYTRVLQGHISIDTAVFPSTTTGYILDAFARRALWADGLDFRHGTGHGVGSFLNVHEGPHGIGTRIAYNEVKLQAGHTVSNEPGFYLDGKFGIRIESIVIVQKATTPHDFGNTGFLKMEHVTMVPIQTKMVEVKLLSPAELSWLNSYNEEVRNKLWKLVQETGDARALNYLEKETQQLIIC